MGERIAALIVDESKWLALSMGLALAAVLAFLPRLGGREPRERVLAALSLFFATTIATMAFGHLLAVSTKLAQGTLAGSPVALYAIGAALAVPAWWLLAHTLRARGADPGRRGLALHLWVVATLVALGLHNLPLAVPGLLDCAYQRHRRRATGLVLAGAAVLFDLALFAGALAFAASGRSFEELTGAS